MYICLYLSIYRYMYIYLMQHIAYVCIYIYIYMQYIDSKPSLRQLSQEYKNFVKQQFSFFCLIISLQERQIYIKNIQIHRYIIHTYLYTYTVSICLSIHLFIDIYIYIYITYIYIYIYVHTQIYCLIYEMLCIDMNKLMKYLWHNYHTRNIQLHTCHFKLNILDAMTRNDFTSCRFFFLIDHLQRS